MSAAAADPASPAWVVVLVHGTFARNAAWVRDGSTFRRMLREEMEKSGVAVTFDVFEWSGSNSHDDRIAAGQELARHIRELAARNPGCRCCVIAHSHGGNIASYAMRDPEARQQVHGIATLGTPFIAVEPRRVATLVEMGTALLVSCTIVFVGSLLLGWLGLVDLQKEVSQVSDREFTIWVGAMIFSGLCGFAAMKHLAPKVLARIGQAQQATFSRLVSPRFDAPPVVSFFTRFDEAGVWLTALSATANFAHTLIALAGLVSISALAFFLLSGQVMTLASDRWFAILNAINGDAILLALGLVASVVILVPVSALLPFYLRGHSLGFGRESLWDNLYARIAIQRDSPSAATSSAIEVPVDDMKGALRHSVFYESPFVARTMAALMTGREVETAGGSRAPDTRSRPFRRYARAAAISLALLALLGAVRLGHYQDLARAVVDQRTVEERHPELVGQEIWIERVPFAREMKTWQGQKIAVVVPNQPYCALVGRLSGTTPDIAVLLKAGRMEDYRATTLSPARVWTSPFSRRHNVYAPFDGSGDRVVEIAALSMSGILGLARVRGASVTVEGDLLLRCWSRRPEQR